MEREKVVIRTSIISILTNILLVIFKALVGFASNSIAIISDAVNNLSDVLSSTITIIGTKLASKAPDKEHPFGHGRAEYISALIVAAIVLYAGITALIESVKMIIEKQVSTYNTFTIIVLVAGIIVKVVLGTYVKNKGKKVNSDSLVASGVDALNDVILSSSVFLSAVIYIFFGISLEAYIGCLVALYIMKSGFELVKEAVDDVIGTRVESEFSKNIKKEVLNVEGVEGAYDLILTDYGPAKFLGSIHIEVKDTLSVTDVDKISRKITKNVAEKYGVILHTIGIYSVNTKDKEILKIREEVGKIVFSKHGILEMHGFHVNKEEKTISFDIIIDFKIKEKQEIYAKIYDEIKEKYDDYNIIITLDVDVSD